MHCYVIYVKIWVFLENQHCILNIEDIFGKFTGHPHELYKYDVLQRAGLCEKTVDFISKKEVPVYFEQHCMFSIFI